MSCRNRSGRESTKPLECDRVLCGDILSFRDYKAADGSRAELVLVDQKSLVDLQLMPVAQVGACVCPTRALAWTLKHSSIRCPHRRVLRRYQGPL